MINGVEIITTARKMAPTPYPSFSNREPENEYGN